ncbi:MAG: hypothetical protein ABR591_09760 [Candidatus Velthaea sp.]
MRSRTRRKTSTSRTFKIAVTAPGDNSVDLYTNDIGVVPLVDDAGAVLGYDLVVGGGLGMTHGKTTTFARLADEFAYVPAERLLAAVRAIVIVQRDHGDRTNRRLARLKYLLADRGLDCFRDEVEAQAGFALEAWRPLPEWTSPQHLGWNDAGDGTSFYGFNVRNGRIRDELKAALREIAAATGVDFVATPDQNVLATGVDTAARARIDAILQRRGIADPRAVAAREKASLACPALPTCGLALAESSASCLRSSPQSTKR